MTSIKKYYNKDFNFTLKDLDVVEHCKMVYDKVKDFQGKFVIICHSIGSIFLTNFLELYKNRCLFGVVIDGTPLGKHPSMDIIWKKYIKKYGSTTEKELQKLIYQVKKGAKDSLKKLDKVVLSNIFKYKSYNNYKCPVPIVHFRNIQLSNYLERPREWKKKSIQDFLENVKNLEKNNPKKFKNIYFIDKTHTLHQNQQSLNIIMDTIYNNL